MNINSEEYKEMQEAVAEPVIEVAPGEYERCAVPVQEAPRICPCKIGGNGYVYRRHTPDCPHRTPVEPQAGAQVPSQDEYAAARKYASECFGVMWDWLSPAQQGVACNIVLYKMWAEGALSRAEAHSKTVAAYATEAAKTPITREDMHDPLLAQTFYDEAKGFERLVLSEIGASK